MSLEFLSTLALGVAVGAAIGSWRTWAFARKLIHMGVGLDEWSDYCESTMQAHGQAGQRPNDKVSDVSAAGSWRSLKLRTR